MKRNSFSSRVAYYELNFSSNYLKQSTIIFIPSVASWSDFEIFIGDSWNFPFVNIVAILSNNFPSYVTNC